MKRDPGVIIYNKGTSRFEYWYQSRELAHSDSLNILMFEYTDALVSDGAYDAAVEAGQR